MLVSYIDDVNLYNLSTSLLQNIIALHADFMTILHILYGLGLSLDFVKCGLTHFTRQHNAVFPDITLPGPDGDVVVTHCDHEMAWHHL